MRLSRRSDLVLLHPPSVYDFRSMLLVRDPIADLIPSGSTFEMYPVGFSYLSEYLARHGYDARIVNLAARMLEDPFFDPERAVARMHPRAFGIGLHWLPHCHGAIEVARLCKRLHPEVPVIMGGYSATLFADELMGYPEVDYVVRGDSTEEPLLQLMRCIVEGSAPDGVPNIYWRDGAGTVRRNSLEYVPGDLSHLGDSYAHMIRSAARHLDIRGVRAFRGWWSYPLTAVLTCRGCTRDCAFCGGSAFSMRGCFGRQGVAYREPSAVAADVRTICSFTGAPIFVIGDLRQHGDGYAKEVLSALAEVAPRNQVVLELFEPAPQWFWELAGRSLPRFDVEISPESHDESVRRAAGKQYGNAGLEACIGDALAAGCRKLDVFFMIGLPGQDRSSVMATVGYCDSLLERFGTRVNPLIGPLAPFLDPGCLFHEDAAGRGYRVLFRGLEDYRRALLEPHWRDILSYETDWMSRQDIVDVTYEALSRLNAVKGRQGQLKPAFVRRMEQFIRESVRLLEEIDRAGALPDPSARAAALSGLKAGADRLRGMDDLTGRELEWPVEGRRFHWLGIARTLLGSGK